MHKPMRIAATVGVKGADSSYAAGQNALKRIDTFHILAGSGRSERSANYLAALVP